MMIMLWKVYFCYDEKQHEINESPGWNWLSGWYEVEWLLRGHFYEPAGVMHLWSATQGQRDWTGYLFRSFQCSHLAYGLCLD